tara:strand:- start:1061 stop:1474 length:414 start_codon:yes stop_codon:yes gene_type:complete
MGIKIKYQDPKSTDFSPNDIVINVKEGSLFYKSNKELFKIQGDKVSTPNTTEFVINNLIKGNLRVSGSIIPDGSGSFDLGSAQHPWKDLHIFSQSIHFYDNDGEIGKLSYIKDKGLRISNSTGSIDGIISTINGGSF